MKRNWKVLNSLMGKNKKEFIADGVSTSGTTKICDVSCNCFIDHPKNIHGSISFSSSHHLDQIEINERSRYFRNATETVIIEPIMCLNKEGGVNDISRKFLVI